MIQIRTQLQRSAQQGWWHVRELFEAALRDAGLSVLPRMAPFFPYRRTLVVRHLRRAEAIARRILVLLACAMELTSPTRRTHKTEPSRSSAKIDEPAYKPQRVPGFRLTEPWPSTTPYHLRQPVGCAGPMIRFFDRDGFLSGPPPKPARIVLEGQSLLRRLQALDAVLKSPDATARRMARWLAKRRRGIRPTPLRIGAPSGRDKLWRRNPMQDPLYNYHYLARELLDRHDSRLVRPP